MIHTSDLAQASGELENVWGPHKLIVGGDRRTDIRLHTHQFRSVMLSYVAFGTDVHVRLEPGRPSYLVHVPLSGRASVHDSKERLVIEPGAAAVLSQDEPVSMRCTADCGQLVVSLDVGNLRAHSRSLLTSQPPGPLQFAMAMDVTSGAARDWYRVLRSFADLADAGDGMLDHPLMTAEIERALMTGLLLAQPNTYSDVLYKLAAGKKRTPVDTAILLIDTYPQRDYTVTELARAAGLSVRTLERQFRRRLGLTPHAYLRHVRFERVRSELMAPASERKRVSEVAARWGLHHFGRFAREYYQKYQEKPSETLRRINPAS
ncbi:AraC family transcriptional regulator [Actinoplanes aureus]|uniref:AraC family transcriptional regulator n=1 Tax=Actinoplanes aureus TaxID=2792083 RepID=A0A931FUH2_9ACTN|nr:AraC family transcriptional regulator [Actinoplanes aureus]MBG0560218.1 AraC family transcriptional regulator [Actinoplanes aureus]